MTNPYFDMTVPLFKKTLTALDNFLAKGSESIVATGKTEEEFLNSRLAPDMFPLLKQIQIATDNAKGCAGRLAGVEIPVMEDNETTVAGLHERIAKTIEFISTLTEDQFEGAGERPIALKYFAPKTFSGKVYLTEYVLPNYFFHVTTAYAIMRMLGADLGKEDYIGGLNFNAE